MRLAVLSLLCLPLLACGASSLRVVDRTPSGGVIAIQPESDSAREQAERYMFTQCPLGYEIVRDAKDGSVSTRRDEQRIHFQCKDAKDYPTDPRTRTAKEVAVHI